MVLVISRFRVANGTESAVAAAFQVRPRLVDGEPGFLGLEVFTDSRDPSLFHLVTRWTDAASYRAWHGSARHRESHLGIPGALKLDPGFTEVLVLDRLDDSVRADGVRAAPIDASALVGAFLESSSSVCFLRADPGGQVTAVNAAFAEALGGSVAHVVGAPLWPHLVEGEADELRRRIQEAPRAPGDRFLLHFADAAAVPFTLHCQLDVRADGFVLIGEPPASDQRAVVELLQTNNDLATLARDYARQSRELARARVQLQTALDDLNQSVLAPPEDPGSPPGVHGLRQGEDVGRHVGAGRGVPEEERPPAEPRVLPRVR